MRGLLVTLVAAGFSTSSPAQTAPPSLTLVGEAGVPKTLSQTELQALPQVEVVAVGRDSVRVAFRGPTLRLLMMLVGAPTGHTLRGPSLLLVVVAEAADSYKVAYSLAELDEQFGARQAIVALTQNGGPIDAEDGPFRIAVAGEDRRARWLRQLTRLRLVRIGT